MSYKSDPKETSIVPVANTALTVKSSTLVRRGLEALTSQELLMIRSHAEHAPEPSRRPDEYKDGVAAYECGDYRTAFVKFMEAANRGHIEAQYMVGRMYDDGRGVLRDDNQAVPWYRKAADQGNALAQSFLGSMYYEGERCSAGLQSSVVLVSQSGGSRKHVGTELSRMDVRQWGGCSAGL